MKIAYQINIDSSPDLQVTTTSSLHTFNLRVMYQIAVKEYSVDGFATCIKTGLKTDQYGKVELI